MMRGRPFEFDRTWTFGVPVDDLWDAMSDTSRFPEWFPWLAAETLGPLEAGARARFRIDPPRPLPYRLRLHVDLEHVVPFELVAGVVTGDLSGPARLELRPNPAGSPARLVWSLEVQRAWLVAAERVARPAMVWGHDAVVAGGLRRFSAALAATRSVDSRRGPPART